MAVRHAAKPQLGGSTANNTRQQANQTSQEYSFCIYSKNKLHNKQALYVNFHSQQNKFNVDLYILWQL